MGLDEFTFYEKIGGKKYSQRGSKLKERLNQKMSAN